MTITPVRAASESSDLAARFARQAEPLFGALSRRARRLSRNAADAEDLFQDTLMHAFMGFHTFDEGSNLKAWLFRIMYNRWVSMYRTKQSRPPETSIGTSHEYDLTRATTRDPAGVRSAEAQALDGFADGEIQEALAALPEGFGVALYLADVEGYTYAETAALMNVPMGTVMSRVSRARKRLRVSLAHLDVRTGRQSAVENCIA